MKAFKIQPEEVKHQLLRFTEQTADDDFFLENTIEREYAYIYENTHRWHEILQLTHKYLPDSQKKSCLDVGTSPFTFLLKKYFKSVASIDYSDAFAHRCQLHQIKFFHGGIFAEKDVLPDQAYDCIFFLEVLEHLHLDPINILFYLKSKLKQGGLLILSTPNMMCLGNRFNMVLNRKLKQFSYPPFSKNEFPAHGHKHDRIYMPAELKEYFKVTGWRHFHLGYHGVRVADDDENSSLLTKLIRQPVLLLKQIIPSLRDRMLIIAFK